MLEAQGWTVVGEAGDGGEALAQARQLHPDLAVVDISMPVMNGLQLTRALAETLPETKVLILSQHDEREMMELAMREGASGYIVKSELAQCLISRVRELYPGHAPSESQGAD